MLLTVRGASYLSTNQVVQVRDVVLQQDVSADPHQQHPEYIAYLRRFHGCILPVNGQFVPDDVSMMQSAF